MTKSFEEFEVHKKSVQLTIHVFSLVSNSKIDKEFGFKEQLKRAVVSITNNIAEGSEYNSNRQFIKYLRIAKGSCAEVRNMLILAKALNLCTADDIEELVKLSIEISQNLSNFIKYLNINQENNK